MDLLCVEDFPPASQVIKFLECVESELYCIARSVFKLNELQENHQKAQISYSILVFGTFSLPDLLRINHLNSCRG